MLQYHGEEMSKLVRALYDFPGHEAGDLAFQQQDVIEDVTVVDDNWLQGTLRSGSGSFPKAFVEILEIPSVDVGHKLYAAIKNFNAEEQGDLGFKKG